MKKESPKVYKKYINGDKTFKRANYNDPSNHKLNKRKNPIADNQSKKV